MKKQFVLISFLGFSMLGMSQSKKEEYVNPLSSWSIGASGGAGNGINIFSRFSGTLVFENNWGFGLTVIHGSSHLLNMTGEASYNHRLIVLGPVRRVRLNEHAVELLIQAGPTIWRKTETSSSGGFLGPNTKAVTTIEYIQPALVSRVSLCFNPSRYFGIEVGLVAAISFREVFFGVDLGICVGKFR